MAGNGEKVWCQTVQDELKTGTHVETAIEIANRVLKEYNKNFPKSESTYQVSKRQLEELEQKRMEKVIKEAMEKQCNTKSILPF